MDGRRIAVRAQQEIGVGGAVDRRDADDAGGALRPHQGDLDPPLAACPGTKRKLDVFSDLGTVEANRDGSAVALGGVDGGHLVRCTGVDALLDKVHDNLPVPGEMPGILSRQRSGSCLRTA
jgi:hypothetical protein